MKKTVVAAAIAAGSLLLSAAPALAGGSTTALEPGKCGPTQIAVTWTGPDPASLTLNYGKPTDGIASHQSLGTWGLSRTEKSSNSLLMQMTEQQRAAVKAIQSSSTNPTWFWSATTRSGTVTSRTFSCSNVAPPIIGWF